MVKVVGSSPHPADLKLKVATKILVSTFNYEKYNRDGESTCCRALITGDGKRN